MKCWQVHVPLHEPTQRLVAIVDREHDKLAVRPFIKHMICCMHGTWTLEIVRRYLQIYDNQFSGTLPSSIAQLQRLV